MLIGPITSNTRWTRLLLLVAALCLTRAASAQKPYSNLPLSFEANQGQAGKQVKFLAHGDAYTLSLTANAAILCLSTPTHTTPIRMELLHANPNAEISGKDQLPGVANYFLGNDPSQWRTNVHTFAKVRYESLYPGISAVFYGNQRQLEYDFLLAPHADPSQIALALTGAQPTLDSEGNIALPVDHTTLLLRKPTVFQGEGASKRIIPASYTIAGNEVRFQLGPYDHTRPLTIDPQFTYLTYLGGTSSDFVGMATPQYGGISPSSSVLSNALAIDAAGNAYVVGETESIDFPTTTGTYKTTRPDATGNNFAVFVSKINPTGTGLVYSTYLGGSHSDAGAAIAVDSAGDAYVTGMANSIDYPTTAGAYQQTSSIGQAAFVTKLNPTGTQLLYSTYLAGTHYAEGYAIAVDPSGQAYVGGNSFPGGHNSGAGDFPQTANALQQPVNEFSSNGFVTVLNPAGSSLVYSTLIADALGTQNQTTVQGIAVDPTGNFYITGSTSSANLQSTASAFQTTTGTAHASVAVAFAAKFTPASATTALTYLTYLRATGIDYQDWGGAITADSKGEAYVAGYTASPTFPTTAGAYQSDCTRNGANSCFSAFVTVLNPTGSALVWSTMLGNAVNEYVSAIALDPLGDVYIAGGAGFGPGFFPVVNPIETDTGSAGFVAEFNPTGTQLLFSTPVGDPSVSSLVTGLAVDTTGNVYAAGFTDQGTGLPTTSGAFQPSYVGGQYDGFVAKFLGSYTLLTPTVTITPSSSSIGQGQPLAITVTISGSGTTPTGTVTLTGGSYTSTAATLVNGAYAFTIPANTLSLGADTFTVTYSGNTNYTPISKSTSSPVVNVTAAAYTLAATQPPVIAPGATTTSTIAVATTNGYAGNVTLTCTLTTSPTGATNLPTCTPPSAPVALTTAAPSNTATVTVTTYAATTAQLESPGARRTHAAAALACLLAFLLPIKRRNLRGLLTALILVTTLATLTGCNGGWGNIPARTIPGTAAGTYTFTVTGTGNPAVTPAPTTTFTVTIN